MTSAQSPRALPEQAGGRVPRRNSQSRNQRQSTLVGNIIHTGLPSAPATWAIEVSTVTTRSRREITAAVLAKSAAPVRDRGVAGARHRLCVRRARFLLQMKSMPGTAMSGASMSTATNHCGHSCGAGCRTTRGRHGALLPAAARANARCYRPTRRDKEFAPVRFRVSSRMPSGSSASGSARRTQAAYPRDATIIAVPGRFAMRLDQRRLNFDNYPRALCCDHRRIARELDGVAETLLSVQQMVRPARGSPRHCGTAKSRGRRPFPCA